MTSSGALTRASGAAIVGTRALRGAAFMALAVLAFGLMDADAKYLGHSEQLVTVLWFRFAVPTAIVAVTLRLHSGRLPVSRAPRLQLLRSAAVLGATGLFYASLTSLPLAEATALSFVSPAIVVLMAGPLLHERIRKRRWLDVGLGFAGVAVLMHPGGVGATPAALLPLAMAVSYAGYEIVTRHLAPIDPPDVTLLYTGVVGALVLSVPQALASRMPSELDLVLLLGLGVMGLVGHFLLIRAFRDAPASLLAPLDYTKLVWASIIGFVAFGSLPDVWGFVGIAMIVVTGVDIAHSERYARVAAD